MKKNSLRGYTFTYFPKGLNYILVCIKRDITLLENIVYNNLHGAV